MTTHTATTPAYVRTEAGVVKVAAGEDVPSDVLPGEVERLTAAGILVESETETETPSPVSEPTSAGPPAADADEPKARPRGKGKDA